MFAHEILGAKPYAFLDDAPLEERRSHAVQTRRGTDAGSDELGRLDQAAIDRVRAEARPDPRNPDELHDALMTVGCMLDVELDDATRAFHAALAAARRACCSRIDGARLQSIQYVAAERIPELLAIHPGAVLEPPLEAPASRARVWERTAALTEFIRGRLCIVGPTTADALAESLAIEARDATTALLALESEGVVLRGCFSLRAPASSDTSDTSVIEWCDRALLARIHRYTLNRLRAEIEPVSPADFMRFLFKWQHVDASDRLTGLDGLREALAQLDGFELAGSAWERSVLPARVDGYDASMLDMLCLAGEIGWARVSPRLAEFTEPAQLTPATPVALFLREHADAWQALRRVADDPEGRLTSNARRVLDVLRARGASFFSDVRVASGLDAEDTRRGLGTLVASGLAASDGFSGLRALLLSASGRTALRDRRATFAGRWSTIAAPALEAGDSTAVETEAWALLRRYGVVFHRLLARENIAAPWRDLARVYRRLEARGEIRGGRFVLGMSGEQFAMPHAIERLREVRRTPADGRLVTIGTADPLNLSGIVTSGDRIRVTARNRIAYRDGVPIAVVESGIVRALAPLDASTQHEVANALRMRRVTTGVA